MKPDQLTVTENNNLTNDQAIRRAYQILDFLIRSTYFPEAYITRWHFEKKLPNDKYMRLTPEEVVKCLKIGIGVDISVGLAKEIMEIGFNCGIFDKLEYKGEESYNFRKPDKIIGE